MIGPNHPPTVSPDTYCVVATAFDDDDHLFSALKAGAKGFTRVEVSDYLTISPNTVASHLKAVYRKLDVTNRAEATLEALRLGLLT